MIDKMKISNMALSIRKELGEDDASPVDIFSLAQMIDHLTLVFYPLGKNISGACFKNQVSSLIAINSTMSIGRQRYTLAHEFYHLFFDKAMFTTICSNKIDQDNENEKKADLFASYFLMPPVALYNRIQKHRESFEEYLSLNEVIRLEQYFGVSHQAMLVRLKEEGELPKNTALGTKKGITSLSAKLGYDISLYKPSSEDKKAQVLGYYICQAEKLLEKDIISNGKYEEFLLDAFRDDIVYGDNYGEGEIID